MARMSIDELYRRTEKTKTRDEEEEILKEMFDEYLKDQFDRVPNSFSWESSIPGIESIALLPLQETESVKRGKPVLQVHIRFKDKGRIVSETIGLDNQGRFFKPQNPALRELLDKKDLLLEILEYAETLPLKKTFNVDINILPPEPGEYPRPTKGAAPVEAEPALRVEDLERLKILTDSDEFLFMCLNENNGYAGYRIAVFNGFIVIENPEVGNAAFFIEDMPAPDPLPKNDQEANAYVHLPEVESELTKSRKQQREEGRAIVHRGKWQDRMRKKIKELTK